MARRLTLDFSRSAAAGGAVVLAAATGLMLANSPWREAAAAWLTQDVPVRLGGWGETLTLRLWTRDGLMTLFFFGLGLELKGELIRGELSSPRRLALPVLIAVGGLVAATATYAAAVKITAIESWSAWPAVLGTDTTLVLAVIGLAARPTPTLQAFALAIALTNNLVLVLALSLRRGGVDAEALAAAAAALCFLALLSRWRAAPIALFVAASAVLWAATLRAGIDPSAAGVAAALMLPMRPRRVGERGLAERARYALQPLLVWSVAPLFVFCTLGPQAAAAVGSRATMTPFATVLAATVAGKAFGSWGACALAARFGWMRRPIGLSWRELLAVAFASGAGLTCSLYGLGASGASGPRASGMGEGLVVVTTSLAVCAIATWALRDGASRVTPAR